MTGGHAGWSALGQGSVGCPRYDWRSDFGLTPSPHEAVFGILMDAYGLVIIAVLGSSYPNRPWASWETWRSRVRCAGSGRT